MPQFRPVPGEFHVPWVGPQKKKKKKKKKIGPGPCRSWGDMDKAREKGKTKGMQSPRSKEAGRNDHMLIETKPHTVDVGASRIAYSA